MAWYAIRTISEREFDVQQTIRDIGFRCECPVAIEQRSRKRGGALIHTEIARPMFPGYVLALMPASDLRLLREERHIYWPLPSWSAPQDIPGRQVDAALALSGMKVGDWRSIASYKPGDLVRRRGDRSGLAMEVTEATAELVVALAEFLGKTHKVKLRPEALEAAE